MARDKPHARPSLDSWYREVSPPPALADWVLALWEIHIPALAEPTRMRIVPNACVDVVIYVSETSRGDGAATIVAPPHRSYVVGSTLRSFVVHAAGWRHVIGASLLPAGVQPLLGLPPAVIVDRVLLLSDILSRRAEEFEDRVITGPPAGALRRMGDVLTQLGRSPKAANEIVQKAAVLVRRSRGTTRIDDLASDMNLSARRLERHFLTHVGLTPKLHARLVRFDCAVRDIPTRGATSWSTFALDHGYSDQAHFINEFREFAGVTPAEFEAESGAIAT